MAIKKEVLVAEDFKVVFYENGIALIFGRVADGQPVTPDVALVARILSALKAGGHRINNYQYISLFPDLPDSTEMCVLVDYQLLERGGEEDA